MFLPIFQYFVCFINVANLPYFFQHQRQLQAQLAKPPVSHTPSQAKPVPKVQHVAKRQDSLKPPGTAEDTSEEEVGEKSEKEKTVEDNEDVEMKEEGAKSE